LVKAYKGRKVVQEVEINVKPGEIVGLLGPNGAGKTTSFYMIVGLVRPTSGKVFFQGKDVTSVPMYKRARMGMGYLSQEPSIFRKLTVRENVMSILETLPISAKERKQRLEFLLEELKISHLAKQRAYTLSGGERRRLEITRALVTNPSIILLDEPFSGVDPLAVHDVQDIVRALRDKGLGVLITDHNVRETLAVVDRAYLLCEGKVLREGDRDFLVNDEVSRELYLGPRFSM
jgi:lipopolysaccharide export system ATP-binding protein